MSSPDETAERDGGTAGTRERLHDISRHFLSDGDAPYRIALYAATDDAPTVPADGLARALAGRGRTVACIDTAARLVSLVRRDAERSLTPGRLSETGHWPATPFVPDILLIATCARDEIAACDLVLFAVPAQASGLRSAYLRLKTLAQSGGVPRTGVTLTGTDDHRDAALRFNRLAVAARDFLGIKIASYSYLPADHRRIEGSLADVARLLLEDRPAVRPERRDRRRDRDEPAGTQQYAAP